MPACWRRIAELFAGAIRIGPAGIASWRRQACGDDQQAQVGLLNDDERVKRQGVLRPREQPGRGLEATAARPGPARRSVVGLTDTIDFAGPESPGRPRVFTPSPVITDARGPSPTAEIIPLIRSRLRALALLYLAIFAILPAWRLAVHRETDGTTTAVNALAVVAIGVVLALLSARRLQTAARLGALELGMAGLIAAVVAVIYYLAILRYSLRGDVTSVQLVMKNLVLYAALLIVTFGLVTPKSRLRTALIVGPLALLPFAILLSLCLVHPGAMGRLTALDDAPRTAQLRRVIPRDPGSRVRLPGRGGLHRLRREVADARRLGPYRLKERRLMWGRWWRTSRPGSPTGTMKWPA